MVDYKELLVWQKSRVLAKQVYTVTQKFPKEETFGLTNQLRRAVVSIPSNIAEGYNRYSNKEYIHFLKIAKGSAAEVETQIILAMDFKYISVEEGNRILAQVGEILRILGSFIASLQSKPVTDVNQKI